MRDCTVIIPTLNMGQYLKALFTSIVTSPFAEAVEEIIFVCDKSTDGSEDVIRGLAAQQADRLPKITLIQPETRRGTFVARYLGAKAARTRTIFFVDSRVTLPAATAAKLPGLIAKYPAMNSVVDIDTEKNIYCLYWQRSHETIFRRTYQAAEGLHTVDASNFDRYLIGGTSFYCPREIFVKASEKYLANPLLSDDTLLMGEIVKEQPFTLHPDYRIQWEPRDSAKIFLQHLYKRGPGFAEYHLFEKRGVLFYAVLLGLVFLVAETLALFVFPLAAVAVLLATGLVLALSTALISKSPREFLRLAPLHVGVILSYGFGALRGAWVVFRRNRALTLKNNMTA